MTASLLTAVVALVARPAVAAALYLDAITAAQEIQALDRKTMP